MRPAMKNRSYLNRLRSKQTGRFIPFPSATIDAFVDWCCQRGMSAIKVRRYADHLRRLRPQFRWRQKANLLNLTVDDLGDVQQFCRVRRASFAPGIAALGSFLQSTGRLAPSEPIRKIRPRGYRWYRRVPIFGPIMDDFVAWSVGRGSSPSTIRMHLLALRDLAPRFLGLGKRTYRDFGEEDLMRAGQSFRTHQPVRRAGILRLADYLRARGWLKPVGRSRSLTLDDINWRTRTLNIFQSKTRQRLALPITAPIGRALVDYLRKGRPASGARQLFLRQRAPAGPLGAPGVACALARAIRSTGAKIETTSFHSLRHAFALRLLRRGTSLKGISDLLGHRDPNSTATYLRLNVEDLRQVALPVPRAITPTTNPDQALVSMPATKAARRPKGTVTDSLGRRSFLARQIDDYLAIQRALGRAFRSEEWVLLTLDHVLARDFPKGHTFTADMFVKWAEVHAVVSPTTRRYRMLCVRKFCRHLARFRPATFIPDVRTFPRKHDHQAPFLLTRIEVGRIISKTATLKVGWQNSFRRPTMRLAWVLLYCCGLRRGELLRLRLVDVEMEHSVLRINETKFYKTRLVPFSRTVREEIRSYLEQRRRRGFPMSPSNPLLWNGRAGNDGGPISPATLVSNWIGTCQAAGVFTHLGRTPRIHDLRHSFAVEALRRGYRTGSHPQATLPRLARYLGHASPDFTHHYLKFTEPLRAAAGQRFHRQVVGSLFSPAQHRHQKGGVS